mgnify:CR=1 FL=1
MLQPPPPPPQETNPASRLRPLAQFSGPPGARVYQTLRQAILSVSYRPGEILRKPEICEVLGVSRSPVADAVARLAAEGLVDVVPQAGTFVARFSMEEIREGAFLREAAELADLVVGVRSGKPVFLREVAQVRDGAPPPLGLDPRRGGGRG